MDNTGYEIDTMRAAAEAARTRRAEVSAAADALEHRLEALRGRMAGLLELVEDVAGQTRQAMGELEDLRDVHATEGHAVAAFIEAAERAVSTC